MTRVQAKWTDQSSPDALLSIFIAAAAGVASGESALWEGEMKEQCWRGGAEREKHPTVSFHCPR